MEAKMSKTITLTHNRYTSDILVTIQDGNKQQNKGTENLIK